MKTKKEPDQKKLTDKQEQFALEYAKDLKPGPAAIRAGYSANTANFIGSQLLNNPDYKHVQNRVKEVLNERAERCKVDADYILERLKNITEARIETYVELITETRLVGQGRGKKKMKVDYQVLRWKDFNKLTEDQLGSIQSIKQGQYGIEIKLFDKSWSLDMIAKHIGFYEADNNQKKPENPVQLYLPDNGRDKAEVAAPE